MSTPIVTVSESPNVRGPRYREISNLAARNAPQCAGDEHTMTSHLSNERSSGVTASTVVA